jgi:hypothetical protein
MINETVRRALLLETHKAIEEAARYALSSIGAIENATIAYPSHKALTPTEQAALKNLHLSDDARSALQKVIADVASYPLSHLFSLMDGVTDPELIRFNWWPGLSLAEKSEAEEMLHDEFFDTYWDYKATRRE